MSERGGGFHRNNTENIHEHSNENTLDVSSVLEQDNSLVQKFQELYSKIDQVKLQKEKENAIRDFYTALDHWAHEKGTALISFEGGQSPLLNKGYLVRRDSPEKVLALLTEQKTIQIHPYKEGIANAATDEYEGLQLALTEGLQGKDIASVYGFHPNSETTIIRVKQSSEDIRDPKRFHYARSFSGDVKPEDVRFVLFRFPVKGVPEKVLTESEEDRLENDPRLRFIYRSITFPKGIGDEQQSIH